MDRVAPAIIRVLNKRRVIARKMGIRVHRLHNLLVIIVRRVSAAAIHPVITVVHRASGQSLATAALTRKVSIRVMTIVNPKLVVRRANELLMVNAAVTQPVITVHRAAVLMGSDRRVSHRPTVNAAMTRVRSTTAHVRSVITIRQSDAPALPTTPVRRKRPLPPPDQREQPVLTDRFGNPLPMKPKPVITPTEE